MQIFKATYGETFDFEFYSEKEREIFLSRYAGAKLPQKQGIKELLQWLKDNGIKTAVASSTNRETVKQELADGGLLDYFSVVIGGDMIVRSKSAQLPFHLLPDNDNRYFQYSGYHICVQPLSSTQSLLLLNQK